MMVLDTGSKREDLNEENKEDIKEDILSDAEIDLEDEFEALKKEYDLPEFEALADDFDIEKAAEKESSYLAREIRKVIVDKFSAYLHLFETLINPASPPMFIFSVLRNMSEDTKLKIREIYKEMSKVQVMAMKADAVYSEKGEAEFIIKAFESWQRLKRDIFKIIETFESSFDVNDGPRRKDYFN